MHIRIPASVQLLLDEYARELCYYYGDKIVGVYIYNSVALGAYDEEKSDIDLLAIIRDDFKEEDWDTLSTLHKQLGKKYSLAKRIEGMYIRQADIGKGQEEISPYLYFIGTKLHTKGYHDLNFVTWYTLQHHGLTAYGLPIQNLSIEMADEQLLSAMLYNLHTYWKEKAKKKLIFLLDEWVEFAVLTLCRIAYTMDTQTIASKLNAASYLEQRTEIAFQLLIQEAVRIRTNSAPTSYYNSKIDRAKEVRRFISYVINLYGNKNIKQIRKTR
ncbi:nucleotidyltransferase domain-containing protein [Priestia taiwanensis]|uniref:Nucleotidyltransferase n=1 Tax=Priestia taiwanensis TaxID=1347902 RepID=A0A917ASE3_9BACI|nr:nucleotidyltransferase domain-containing protein [Priestia taiwanensis]MBM7363007.1 hypothetical protein [Priestia taiwanensis]GGE66882.1 nucleotidyltransferase [Priestia taiwanensis]